MEACLQETIRCQYWQCQQPPFGACLQETIRCQYWQCQQPLFGACLQETIRCQSWQCQQPLMEACVPLLTMSTASIWSLCKKNIPIMTMSTASIWSLFAKGRGNKMPIMTLSTASDGSQPDKDKCAPFGKPLSTVHSSWCTPGDSSCWWRCSRQTACPGWWRHSTDSPLGCSPGKLQKGQSVIATTKNLCNKPYGLKNSLVSLMVSVDVKHHVYFTNQKCNKSKYRNVQKMKIDLLTFYLIKHVFWECEWWAVLQVNYSL